MRGFGLFLAPIALCIVGACSSSAGGTNPNPNQNQPPPTPNVGDINIVQGASLRTTTAFAPNPKTVALGGGANVTVRWINADISGGDYMTGTPVVHHIVSDNGAFAASPNLGGNDTYSIQLSAAGDYAYHCSIHPNMVGTIHVDP